jgi:hypothetical protein
MGLGDTVIADGIEYEVVWDGGEGLIGDRMSKQTGIWIGPKRLYNKKDTEFWDKDKRAELDKELEGEPVVREGEQ